MNKARLYIGTSGYSYQHWKNVFYPPDLKEAKWLEYYALSFDTVELNVTFYRLLQGRVFTDWRNRTPEYFRFSVKGSRFITHIKRLKDCDEPLKMFFARAALLKEKLGPVLWQLPPAFKINVKRLADFLKSLKKYKKFKHVLEFRNETWCCKEILNMLGSENISVCSADWPVFNNDIRPTADFIYVRRHGHGAKLYSGCYSDQQLKKDASVLAKHIAARRDAYIYFNNDAHGYAVKNALLLKAITGST